MRFAASIVPAILAAVSLAACVKKGGEAVVIERDYVAPTYSTAAGEEGRVLIEEQWILRVRMRDDSKIVRVPVDRPEWEKAKAGDRVNVRYSQGKYTGTVWAAELK